MKKKVKIFSHVILGSWLLMFTSLSISAQLSINDVNDPSSSSNCDGSIDITAAGDSGPFVIEVISMNSGDTIASIQDVTSSSTVSELCEGEYDIYAVNRFGCNHSLGIIGLGNTNFTNTAVSKSYTSNGFKAGSTQIDINVKAYPNPFAHDVTISIKAYGDLEFGIQIYDVVGQIVYDKTVAVDKGVNDFLITDMKSAPSGIYLVHITDKEQRLLESFKIFKTDNGGQDDDDDD